MTMTKTVIKCWRNKSRMADRSLGLEGFLLTVHCVHMVGICKTWTKPFLGVVSFSLLGNPPDRSGSSFDTPLHGCHLAPGSPRHLLFFDTFFCCALFGRALVCVAGCGQLWKAVVLPPSSGREEKTAPSSATSAQVSCRDGTAPVHLIYASPRVPWVPSP